MNPRLEALAIALGINEPKLYSRASSDLYLLLLRRLYQPAGLETIREHIDDGVGHTLVPAGSLVAALIGANAKRADAASWAPSPLTAVASTDEVEGLLVAVAKLPTERISASKWKRDPRGALVGVDLDEFLQFTLAWYLARVREQMARLTRAFHDFDADGNRLIDRTEFEVLVCHCIAPSGREVTPMLLATLWAEANALEGDEESERLDTENIAFGDAFAMVMHRHCFYLPKI